MKAPSFQLYPQDFISSLDCQTMELEEFGAYNWLLFHSWIQEPQGYLPNNQQILSKLLRINPRTFSKMWRNTLEKKFKISECGKFIYNERLISEAEKQAKFREKQAENGAKGGRPRKEDKPEKPKPNPSLLDGLESDKPKKSSSTSSSTSVDNNKVLFDEFRILYPGSKRGNDTEFENFCKKHKNWKDVLPSLKALLEQQIEDKKVQASSNQFVAPWPNLSTYINNKRWEDELATPPPKQQTLYEPTPQEHMTEQEVNDLIGLKPDTKVYTPKFQFNQ